MRNAIINTFVAKDVSYGHVLVFTAQKMKVFRKACHQSDNTWEVQGKTWNEMAMQLGYGDEEKGAAAIQRGLDRRDIYEEKGLYYFKRHTRTFKDTRVDTFEEEADGEGYEK